MSHPAHKTKIVCTIGPASESPETMRHLLLAGMDIARLNFSHGDFDAHKRAINNLREAARATGRPLAIMADLPGPKMRIGELAKEPVSLKQGDAFILTTDDVVGDRHRASVSFSRLIARGSALACAACLDVLVAKKRVDSADAGKAMLVRIVSMLVGLIRSTSASRVYEAPAAYCAGTAD